MTRKKDYPDHTTHRKRSVLPPKLQTDIAMLSKAIDRDMYVATNLSHYISGIRRLPPEVIVRAAAEIQTIGEQHRDWEPPTEAEMFLPGRLSRPPATRPKVALAKYPQLANLFVFHADGRLREAALKGWPDPPDSPFGFVAIAYRLNDWVKQVRDAACDCADRLFPSVCADIVAEALFYLFTQSRHWGRWGARERHILDTTLFRRDVMQVFADLLKCRRSGHVAEVFRRLLSQPGLDDALPMLAREAAMPSVRAIAYETLMFRRAQWQVGYQYEWVDKRYFIRRRVPELERRPLDHQLDIEKLIVEAAQDRVVVVRKVAARGLIDLREDLSSEMVQVGKLLSRDKAMSVRTRAEFYLNNISRM